MDAGWNGRLDILKRDAERSVLSPLREHGWDCRIVSEVKHGEHLLITAERGGHSRNIAMLYSSATANDIYKQLDEQVDIILVNGDLWKLESYASGIKKPIKSADGFHEVLIQWNRETSTGKFAPETDADDIMQSDNDFPQILLSETPIEAIWLRLRQLQSVRLSKNLVLRRAAHDDGVLDEEKAAAKAEGISFALRNATDYYNALHTRNLSQKILNLYYGTMAFAFAEMLASPTGPSTLVEIENSTKQGHGLYTIDGKTSDLEDIVVGIIQSGFFPRWMKQIGKDCAWVPAAKPKRFSDLNDGTPRSWVSIGELFMRIPEISDLALEVIGAPNSWLHVNYDQAANHRPSLLKSPPVTTRTYCTLTDLSGRLSLADVAEFPGSLSELRQLENTDRRRRFRAAVDHEGLPSWWHALPLHNSPFSRSALIKPMFSDVTEFRAICFSILYALSIVVRYRPSIWRRVQEGDLDHMRILIEAFLAAAERILPEQFLAEISGRPVFVRQPGSMF